jgi:hypothetical protein
MDQAKLQARLKNARLVLGNIEHTVQGFFGRYAPAPIGAALFDLDLYSSTRSALKIFDGDPQRYLPRVRCYFDDVLGNEITLTNDYTGEKLAINEYNAAHATRKVTPVAHLLAKTKTRKWYYKSFVHHAFDHPLYSAFIAEHNQSIPLHE